MTKTDGKLSRWRLVVDVIHRLRGVRSLKLVDRNYHPSANGPSNVGGVEKAEETNFE
jgi:hypothetical protein